ncbi:MAG TPA: M20/M25/M40 family metallo-hydrolase [Gemmatimonadales bacterium]|nr:M20/M25/M40 family metallo-hydrolase [Gemmatimonadales bacterium]
MRLVITFGLLAATVAPAAAQNSVGRLLTDVRYLSHDRLQGRLTGTPGADSAAAYIARRFAEVGLTPPAGGWFQDFTVSPDAPAARHAPVGGARGRNVVGLLRGSDPARREEIVVVGAHYDHLGLGGPFALDPDSTGAVHNGADDNASGTAALIEVAARLARRPPARSVAFIAFGGEELGLLGSAHYVRESGNASGIAAMLNLDMVGRLKHDRLIVYGTGSATEFPTLLDSLNRTEKFELALRPDGYGPSDQSSFYAAGIPVLHFFTNVHEDYHRSTDDWQKIDVPGLARVAGFAASVTAAIAGRPARPTFVALPATAHGGSATGTGGYGAYLGTVPDMSGSESGVRLAGVRAGSPAEKAGLRADDVITKIGDYEVPDLEAMTTALRSYKPGDTVEIVVRREGSLVTLTATLGSRGT